MKMARVQIDLPVERVEDLKKLNEECGFSTYKELFNSALAIFEWAVNERRSGRNIASIDEANSVYKELAMPGLQAIRNTRGTTKNLLVA